MRKTLAVLSVAVVSVCAWAVVNEAAIERFKSLPGPMQSADGALYVACQSPDRANLRWPVLRFAEGVRENLSDAFVPLGTADAPLLIVLGTETNRVASVTRRSVGAADGFSQLAIHVPNPETVDLEVFRERIAEALLRERARSVAGAYASLQWPEWFIRAVVDASRGNVWRAEAYEKAHDLFAKGELPPIDAFFAPDANPPREVAAFFAQWVLERNASEADRTTLLTARWVRPAVLGAVEDDAWPAWFRAMEDTIFVPGTLTRSQFERWTALLTEPKDAQDAVRISNDLTRYAVGRPKAFRDLTALYLSAYGAFATGDTETYRIRRTEADSSRDLLAHILSLKPILEDTPPQGNPAP